MCTHHKAERLCRILSRVTFPKFWFAFASPEMCWYMYSRGLKVIRADLTIGTYIINITVFPQTVLATIKKNNNRRNDLKRVETFHISMAFSKY